ncbi:hypothetical protein [Lactobacillus porci]|uniref:hypothetical protein n=1 Tax=Lactobacillus porci TaxID=2012477 RepID=UPI003991B9CA
MINKQTQKFLWSLLLFFDVLLFLFALLTQNVPSIILVALIASLIHHKGNDVMFGEFDKKQKAKYEAARLAYERARKAKKQI